MGKVKERKQLIKNLIMLLVVIVICFIFLEIIIRFVWQEPGYGYPVGLHIPDNTKGYKYKPYFEGNFPGKLYKNIEIKINSKGLRDYNHEYSASADKIRILGLGDSVAFGSGVAYEDTYLSQLEKKFLEKGYNVEIIKAGINGYEFNQEYTYFLEEGYKYDPDILLIGVVLNDVVEADVEELRKSFEEKQSFSKSIRAFLRKHCKTCRLAHISILNIAQKEKLNGTKYNRFYFETIYDLWEGKSWEIYETQLLNLNDYLKEKDIELVLVIFPYAQQFENSLDYGKLPQEQITNTAKLNGIIVVDLTDHLDLENYKDFYLVADDLHLNAEGYQIAANVIYSELANAKIFKEC